MAILIEWPFLNDSRYKLIERARSLLILTNLYYLVIITSLLYCRCQSWDVVTNMAQGHFLSDTYRSDKLYHDLYKKAKDVDTAAQLFVNDNDLLTSSTNIQVVQSL